jgi:hypothetical protein
VRHAKYWKVLPNNRGSLRKRTKHGLIGNVNWPSDDKLLLRHGKARDRIRPHSRKTPMRKWRVLVLRLLRVGRSSEFGERLSIV